MVALTIGGGGARTLHGGSTAIARLRPVNPPPCSSLQFTSTYGKGIINNGSNRNASIIVAKASKKQDQLSSSRTGKFDSKNRRSTTLKEEEGERGEQGTVDIQNVVDEINGDGIGVVSDDGKLLPELPGLEPDFWEGPQWDTFGFFIQYLWAIGILFALVACGIAVATYNEGASDFKQTPAYKESIQSRELLEEPEGSNSDVFESNPTEEAPSLE